MPQIVELILSWIVTNGLTYAILRFDEGRMSEATLERAWPSVSRDSAILGFGPLTLPIHFLRTRTHFHSWRGVVFGLPLGLVLAALSLVVLFLGLTVLEYGFELAGLPVDD